MTIEETLAQVDSERCSKLSHELRQPLSAMKTWIELLENTLRERGSEKQRRYVEKIEAEMQRMTGLLDELSRAGKRPS